MTGSKLRKDSEITVLIVFSIIILSFAITPDVFGVGLTFGPELTLSDSPGDSAEPQIVVNDTNIYVVWVDDDSTNGDSDILFKRSTDSGTSFSSTAINVTTNLVEDVVTADPPQIAYSDTAAFVYIVWEDGDIADTDNDIYFARSIDSGATFELPLNMSAGLTGDLKDPAIAANGTNVYVAWSDASTDTSGDIYFRASTDGGATWTPSIGSAPTIIWNSVGETSEEPKLGAYGNNVYLVWEGEDVSTQNDRIFFRASTDNGATWTPSVGSTPSDFGGTDANVKRDPSLAVDGDNIHITWRESTSKKIFQRTVTDTAGSYTFSPTLASAPTTLRDYTNTPFELKVDASEGNVNVVWRELVANPDRDIFFTNSTDSGSSFSSVSDLSGNAIEATESDIVIDGLTSFVVWSNVNSGTDSDIVALASVSSSGAKYSGVASEVTDDTDEAENPSVATDGTKMYVVWEDFTGDTTPEIRFRVGTLSGEDVDFNKSTYKLSDTATIKVTSPTSNTNSGSPQQITATVTSDSEAGNISVTLTETGNDTNEFTGTFTFATDSSNDSSDILKASPGDTVSGTFGSTTTNVSIFTRTVALPASTYTIGDTTYVTVTDQNSNTNTGTKEKITATVSSSIAGGSTTLQLTETGVDTGIFGDSGGATLRFSNEIAEIPLNRGLTITQEFTASQGTTDVTVASETESGVAITLEEQTTLGQYKDQITFKTSVSSGNLVQAAAGEFVTFTKGTLVTYGIITPRTDLSKAVLQVDVTGNVGAGVKDTITATFGTATDTATVDFSGGESGGGGGGLVRPSIVLNAVASLTVGGGGSADRSAPISSLDNVLKLKSVTIPDHIKSIIENQKPNVAIEPLENEAFSLPLSINEKSYPLGSNENTIVTNKIKIGESTKFKMVFYEQSELEHVSIYMNLRDGKQDDQSDTYVIFEKRSPMKIVDKNGFFENVSVEVLEEGPYEKIAIFDIKFAKPMETSDLIYKTWDLDRRGSTIQVHDALKVGEIKVEEETPIETTDVTTKEKAPVPNWIKSNARWWSEGGIDDKTFTNGISYLISEKIIDVPMKINESKEKDENGKIIETEEETNEVKVPDWIKTNAQWWADDLLDEETFLAGIEYMVKQEIITVS